MTTAHTNPPMTKTHDETYRFRGLHTDGGVCRIRIYERAGFKLVHQETHATFGKELIGETWELELRQQ